MVPTFAHIFRRIFLNENIIISIQFSLKLIPKDLIDIESMLVQVMVWFQIGEEPLLEPMLAQFTDAYMYQ